MRKMLSATLIVCVVAFLSTLWMPAVHAKKPITVEGTWSWTGEPVSIREAGGNTFISAVEIDEFDGTFEGDGEGPFTVTIHPTGFMTGRGRTVFDGEVQGEWGTLVIQWTGETKTLGRWLCKWVILSGTEDLANLRGQGKGVETAPESYVLDMSGKIQFD